MLDFISLKLKLFNLSLVNVLQNKSDLKYKLFEQKYGFHSHACVQVADTGLSHVSYADTGLSHVSYKVDQQRYISPICYSQLKLTEHII